MVIQGDEDGQRDQSKSEGEGELARTRIGKCSIAHEACGVNHAELVHQLHWICDEGPGISTSTATHSFSLRQLTLEGGVEAEAPCAHKQIANKTNEEDGVMPMLSTALDSSNCKEDEPEIGQSIDDFSRVWCGIVVLDAVSECLSLGPRVETSSHQLIVELTGLQ